MNGRLGMTGDQVVRGDAVFGKSFVPGKGYVSAVDVPVRQLRELAHGGRAKAQYRAYLKESRHWDKVRAESRNASDFISRHGSYHSTKGALKPNVLRRDQITAAAGGDRGVDAFALKTGSRKGGTARVFAHPGTPSHTLTHEAAHIAPKRSGYRMYQIGSNPRLAMREEARADYLAGHHYKDTVAPGRGSGYARAASSPLHARFARELAGGGPRAKMFTRPSLTGYRDVQDRMAYAGARSAKPVKVTKAERRPRQDYSGAMVGSGAVVGGVGLVGGGIPGVRSTRILADVKSAPGVRGKAANVGRAYRGGEFGYRTNAHQTFKTFGLGGEAPKKASRLEHYKQGERLGRVEAEDRIIRHLKHGRKVSNAPLLAGGGYQRSKRPVRKRDSYRSDAAIGAGATTAALGGGGSLVLDSQGRKWSRRSAAHLEAARQLNPRVGGYDTRKTKTRVPDVRPHRRSGENVAEHARVFAGRSNEHTHAVGYHRGAAAQGRYFARVYGAAGRGARWAGGAGALLAGGGLVARHRGNRVRKSLAMPKGVRIPGVNAVTDLKGNIVMLSDMPKVHPGNPQRVLHTVRRHKRKLARRAGAASVAKVETTMSEAQAHRLAARYDTRGPLPKGLSREKKMQAYEARYIAAGGKKGEKWQRRADRAEVGRNIGLVGATTSAAALLAARGKRTGPKLAANRVTRHATPHRLETAALSSALGGGWSELYGEHARSRRASYANSPSGVAGSALTRMRAYTPEKRTS